MAPKAHLPVDGFHEQSLEFGKHLCAWVVVNGLVTIYNCSCKKVLGFIAKIFSQGAIPHDVWHTHRFAVVKEAATGGLNEIRRHTTVNCSCRSLHNKGYSKRGSAFSSKCKEENSREIDNILANVEACCLRLILSPQKRSSNIQVIAVIF